MRFLILDTDYPEFLNRLYDQHLGLENKSYAEQMQIRVGTLFGQVDFCSSNLNKLGHQANDIYVNNEPLQQAWAKEHGLKVASDSQWQFRLRRGVVPWISRVQQRRWFNDILAAQIRHYKPDIFLNLAMDGVSSQLLREVKPYVRLLIGQHPATLLSDAEDWTVYDLVVSSFPPTLQWFRSRQVPAEMIRLGFEPRVLSHLKGGERHIPASFVGSFHNVHSTRIQWLEHVCRTSQVQVWSSQVAHLPPSSFIRRSYVGPAWGKEMYQVLRNSLLTLNHHGNIPPFANNLRLFQATGVGTLLITDWKENLSEMFDLGKEVIAYRTPEECAELIQYYLEHDDERQAVASAGQHRTLRDHTYSQRMQQLVNIVNEYL